MSGRVFAPRTAVPRARPLTGGTTAQENSLVLWHIYTATAALALGSLFGVLQGFSRANFITMPPMFDYYRMLTAHGVLMALVFTTFFITGLCTYATYKRIVRENRPLRLAWISYAVMVVGTVMAAVTIMSGEATVLYTFYAPLKTSPWFYFGATILIVGTWGVTAASSRTSRGSSAAIPATASRCLPSWPPRPLSCGSSRRSASSPRWRCSSRGLWDGRRGSTSS